MISSKEHLSKAATLHKKGHLDKALAVLALVSNIGLPSIPL